VLLTEQSPEELHREREELKKTLIRKVSQFQYHFSEHIRRQCLRIADKTFSKMILSLMRF